MATRQRGWPAKNVSTCSRLSFLRNTTAPDTLAPCAWNTCLARSRPIVLTSSTDASLRWSSNTTTLARRCCRGASTPSLEDDDVPGRLAARPGRGAMAPRRPINGETFRLYVDKVLAPTLRQGDIVVMDNLGSHKSKAVRRAIRAAGARLLFLPKYS